MFRKVIWLYICVCVCVCVCVYISNYFLSQNIDYSSLWYTVGPYWLSIIYIHIHIHIYIYAKPKLPICPSGCPSFPFPFGNRKFVFEVYEPVSALQLSSFAPFSFLSFLFICFFGSTCEQYHIWFSLSDLLRMIISRSIHVAGNGIIACFFMIM